MEAVGLTIGAVALVGTFKDCLELLNMVTTARSLGRDALLLDTKLDVEKLLFLQWADRVGLVDPNRYDKRLDEPTTHRTIARVLTSVKALLSDSAVLRERYGLDVNNGIEIELPIAELKDDASGSRMSQFFHAFDRLAIKHQSLHLQSGRTTADTGQRLRWVIRDKEKFDGLIQELSYFNSRLDHLVSRATTSALEVKTIDLAHIRSIPKLKAISAASAGYQPNLLHAAQKRIKTINENRILEQLWFRWIYERHTNIKEKHYRTLEWALEPPSPVMEWDNLSQWLEQESGIFWLAGKAGSGKSTLMKHLHGHYRTEELLQAWAKPSELICLQFFFYALGRPEQKSQEGLFRGLLFQILDADRSLIEFALPQMWQEAVVTEDCDGHELALPSGGEMQASLLQFGGELCASKKFCLFIDGLDEFEGNHAQAVSFFHQWSQYPNMKILISSRPLSSFVAAFQVVPKLYLQDLTRGDIAAYIADTITRHPYMDQLAQIDRQAPSQIERDLFDKASGVFLWVVLACQSILEGFAGYDDLSELRARVDELPSEVEDLFKQMINKIERRWCGQGAKLLRLVFDNQATSIPDPIPLLGLALSDEHGLRADYSGPCIVELAEAEKLIRCEMMEGRLRSRCSGLVEANGGEELVDSYVVFMHRSVYEFLCAVDIWAWPSMHIADPDFYSAAVLSMIWTQMASLQPWGSIDFKNSCIRNLLHHASDADKNGCPPAILVTTLSRLQYVLRTGSGFYGPFWDRARELLFHKPICDKICDDLSFGIALATEMGMVNVVRYVLTETGDFQYDLLPVTVNRTPELRRCVLESKKDATHDIMGCQTIHQLNLKHFRPSGKRFTVMPLLYHATCQPLLRPINAKAHSPNEAFFGERAVEMTEYLLSVKAQPNEQFFYANDRIVTTSWDRWLKFVGPNGPLSFGSQDDSDKILNQRLQIAHITQGLLEADAEVTAVAVRTALMHFMQYAFKKRSRPSLAQSRNENAWLGVKDAIELRTGRGTFDDLDDENEPSIANVAPFVKRYVRYG